MKIATVGLDLAKAPFLVCESFHVVFARQLRSNGS